MSVDLMSLVFKCNMPELKTDDGRTVPDSTAKFVLLALADHANDEGEGAYPGVKKICRKTNFSVGTVTNALNALRTNGFTRLEGRSKLETYNYTILVAEIVRFQWLESDDSNGRSPAIPVARANPSLTTLNHKKDKDIIDGYVELSQTPGLKKMARIDAILSAIGARLRVNSESKPYKEFARFVDERQQAHGESLDTFLNWMTRQKGFDIQFWPPRKMQELWPQAFGDALDRDDRHKYVTGEYAYLFQDEEAE